MIYHYSLRRNVPDADLLWSAPLMGSPIVIDNGSFECRAGYAYHSEPHLVFRNFIYRPRMSKSVLVGNDIPEPDSVAHMLKSPFMEGLLTGIDSQEQVLDHIFTRLGVRPGAVDHPIFINEILCNPKACRIQLTELLFETFSVSHLAFYVDFLAAYYENHLRECSIGPSTSSGECLLVSLGHQTSHIVPLVSTDNSISIPFQPLFEASRRLHIGGAHISWIIQRLLHLKYPCHTERVTFGLSEHLMHNFGKFAVNYRQELDLWRDSEYRNLHTKIIQLPFVQTTVNELNATADRKRAQSSRMHDLHRRRHMEQLDSAHLKLDQLLMLNDVLDQQHSMESVSLDALPDVAKCGLRSFNISSRSELLREIETCKTFIARLEHQIAQYKPNGTPIDVAEPQINTRSENPNSSSVSAVLQLFGLTGALRPMSELNDRQKRAVDSLLSLALPAAVQSQMVAAPLPGEPKLSEAKLRQRMRLAQDLESDRGSDFLSWLISVRHRRQKVIKRRTFRQSRVDLATEIGLHSNPIPQETVSSEVSRQPKTGAGVGPAAFLGLTKDDGASLKSQETSRNMSSDGDGRGAMTERRRIQLEKIRAMAAELKPTRGRGSKTSVCRPPRLSRGGSVVRAGRTARAGRVGRSRGSRGRGKLTKSLTSTTVSKKRHDLDQEEVNQLAEDLVDPWTSDFKEFDESDIISATHSPWDTDFDDTNVHPSTQSETKQGLCAIPSSNLSGDPITSADNGDESENERDNIAVFDALLALYDPEVSKDLGTTNLHMSVNEFYQIHVDTELLRASEVVFHPSFIGSSEAGIGEAFEFVLRDTTRIRTRKSTESSHALWPMRVFLTGGLASVPFLAKRIFAELRPHLPYGAEYDSLEVVVANDPRLDAWRGARRLALNESLGNIYISRKMYEEYGADRFIHHALSNQC